MKIVFISNYLNHHQKKLCDTLYAMLNGEFLFITTSNIGTERIKLGYEKMENPCYVKEYIKEKYECQINIDVADIVIFGSAPYSIIKNRIKKNKVVIRYSERINKDGIEWKKFIPRFLKYNMEYPFWKKNYLLAASGFAAYDYNLYGLFSNKVYKWGYFPEKYNYDIKKLFNEKNKNRILWCGRFINWKHPEQLISVASRLQKEDKEFEIVFVGTGPLEEELRRIVFENKLEKNVLFLGSMRPTEARKHMVHAGIMVATSDFGEGWGAVINEAMNSGCAVVASHAMGSVPFLIKNKENGIIYKNGDINDLYEKVKYLLDNPHVQEKLGCSAYETINSLWNPKVAAERFIKFSKEILDHGYCDVYDEGPCSKAQIIKNDWFTGDV